MLHCIAVLGHCGAAESWSGLFGKAQYWIRLSAKVVVAFVFLRVFDETRCGT